jgi:hypothetical protein
VSVVIRRHNRKFLWSGCLVVYLGFLPLFAHCQRLHRAARPYFVHRLESVCPYVQRLRKSETAVSDSPVFLRREAEHSQSVCELQTLQCGRGFPNAKPFELEIKELLKEMYVRWIARLDRFGSSQSNPSSTSKFVALFVYVASLCSSDPRVQTRASGISLSCRFAAMTLLRKLVTFASQEAVSASQDAVTVRAVLSRIVPSALPRAVLSRAIQHRSSSIKV